MQTHLQAVEALRTLELLLQPLLEPTASSKAAMTASSATSTAASCSSLLLKQVLTRAENAASVLGALATPTTLPVASLADALQQSIGAIR